MEGLEQNFPHFPIEKSKLRQRRWLSLEHKLEIISAFEDGDTATNIGRVHGLNESTVRCIIRNKDKVQRQARNTYMGHKVALKCRTPAMENMELNLVSWIEECNALKKPLSIKAIKAKGRELFRIAKEEQANMTEIEERETFDASSGWFERFKLRTGLHCTAKLDGTDAWHFVI